MEQSGYEVADLNAVFGALADPTRRSILARLSQGKATVGELAEPFEISQPAVSRHLKVLESAGLIKRGLDRQMRPAEITAQPLSDAVTWLQEFRDHWTDRLDNLDQPLSDLQQKDTK